MRALPRSLPDEGLLVGWSLEPGRRRNVIGFHSQTPGDLSPSTTLEPILDTGEGHLLTVAPTGAGKGTGCIMPALLRYPGPVIVIDPKGENYAVTARRRREMGQQVVVLDPFEITSAKERYRFNPLDLADSRSSRFVEDVATLANLASSSTKEDRNGENIFWREMGRTLVAAAMIDVLTMPDSEESTLTAVRGLINSPLEDLRNRAEKWKDAGQPELRRLAGILNIPASETLGGYLAFAIHQLDFLKGAQIEEHLSASDLDLNAVYEGDPVSIYLVLPPDKLESHAGLLRLWIGTLIAVITRRTRRPKHATLMLIDEAAQLGELPQLRQAITLLRGYGVRVWTFWQDLSQMRNLYPADWETLLNNCRVQQYFGATTALAADAIVLTSGYGTRESVLDLERDEMILNISGDEPVVARTPNYRYDPPFEGAFDANPFYVNLPEEGYVARSRPVYRKTEPPSVRHRARTARQAMILANRIFHPIPAAGWTVVDGDERVLRLQMAGIANRAILDDNSIVVRRCPLPFYKGFDWYDIEDRRSSPARHAYFAMDHATAHLLNGSSSVIHDLNEKCALQLSSKSVLLYLEFFSTNVHGDLGRFLILDAVDEVEWREAPEHSFLEDLRQRIAPPRLIASGEPDSGYLIGAELTYENSIFEATFRIGQSGDVTMEEDTPIAGDLPIVSDLERLRYIGSFDADGKFTSLRAEL